MDSDRHERWWTLIERLQALPAAEGAEPDWEGRLVAAVRDAFEAAAVVCLLPAGDGGWQRWLARADGEPAGVTRLPASTPSGWLGDLIGCRRAETAQPDDLDVLASGGRADAFWDGLEAPAGTPRLGARLRLPGPRDGALLVVEPVLDAGSGRTRPVAALVAGLGERVAQALRNRERVRRLAEQVITDELTGAYNYRHLLEALEREVRRARRFGHPLSVLMLDVDHLKEYNERHGHLRGSALLRELAHEIRAGTREIDILAKYGGDEFLLILPHTEKAGAQVLAGRLCRRVASRAFAPLEAGAMTCSIGVAACPEDGDEPETLMASADAALFAAKRGGRNRVCAA